jgi:arginyl-tRNA synthetase
LLSQRIEAALSELTTSSAPAVVQPASRPEFGDYQANGVMGAAKRTKVNPRELAAKVADVVAIDDLAEPLGIAGPGFLNITLRDAFIADVLANAARVSAFANPQTVVVDYSSPNLAKEMHVGHLRSTIIGDAMARVLEALGHNVIRQNHVGDWGTQFGMLLAHLADTGDDSAQLADLEEFYRAAKARFDAEPEFAERARAAVVGLQSGDPDANAQWQRFIDISLTHCQQVYERLGVRLSAADVAPESGYNNELPNIIDSLEQRALIEESDGALCVFPEEFTGKDGQRQPVIVRKSDGGYLYATTDLAAIRYRSNTLHADRILYYTDARQNLHFKQIFAVARLAEFTPADTQLEHHPFGAMLGADGKPFKTRDGGVIRLTDLLDEAQSRALQLVTEKNPDLSDDERTNIARVVGIGAVKYADLSKNRTSDYVFDWDQMLSFEGNTAPYLQYAYSRIKSLFRRGEIDPDTLDGEITLNTAEEHNLGVTLLRLQEVLEQVAAEGFPHYLCAYLYDLATSFTRFYEACPVLSAAPPLRSSRLQLCRHTAATLRHGLDLLGIATVERM